MIRCRGLTMIALASGLAAACAAPQGGDIKYKVEGAAVPKDRSMELVVKVQDVATGKYVADAQVWHVDVVPIGFNIWGPKPSEARHAMAADGNEGYAIRLAERPSPNRRFEHFIIRVPGEDELVHATIAVPVGQ